MKKSLFFISIIFIFTCLFTSCLPDGESVYWESWFEKKGKLSITKDAFGDETIGNFYTDVSAIPENTTTYLAKRYSHKFVRTPVCRLYIQQWQEKLSGDDADIGYETIKDKRFTITSTPQEIYGFWFCCDEDGNVYIYNVLYDQGFEDKKATEIPKVNEYYRFKFDISGIQNLEIEMKKTKKTDPWD